MTTGAAEIAKVFQPRWKLNVVPSAAPGVDRVLHGGFPRSQMTSIAGPSGTGKTLLAMMAVIEHLSSNAASTALWVDAVGLDVTRFAQLVCSNVSERDSLFERIRITRTLDIHAVIDACTEARKDKYLGMMVIDNIAVPVNVLTDKNQIQANALVVSLLRTLALLTYDQQLCTLLINSTVKARAGDPIGAFASTSSRPALGATYAHCIDLSILLSTHQHSTNSAQLDTVIEILHDRRGSRMGNWTSFRIESGNEVCCTI